VHILVFEAAVLQGVTSQNTNYSCAEDVSEISVTSVFVPSKCL
jgi:hypothetical protein